MEIISSRENNASKDLGSCKKGVLWSNDIESGNKLDQYSENILIRAGSLSDIEKIKKGIEDDTLVTSSVEDVSERREKGKLWPQFLAAFAANMGAFAFGSVMAWSATGIASLHETSDLGELSLIQQSWIGAIATLGAVAACPIAGFGLVNFGRKKSMLYLTLPFILGWMLIAFAQSVVMVYAGRFLTGFCGGAFSITAPVFTAETADANIRGGLGSLFDLLLSLGMLYIYVIGDYCSWRYQAFACALIPIAFHLVMFFVPESPRYLVEKDKTAKAEKALTWLKGTKKTPHLVQWELSELSRSVEEGKGLKVTLRSTLKRPILKPTLILIGIMFFTTLSGVDAVVAYTVEIFESAGASMGAKECTIIIGVTQVLSTIPSALIVDHAGRRLLLMISDTFMTLSLVVMGLYFYIKTNNLIIYGFDHDSLSFLPLASLISFVVAYSFGYGPLSMMMIGEILPNHMKGVTSCVVLMSRWLLAFTVTYFFETLKECLDDDGTYWFFAVICFMGIFYVYFFVPETSGKTLDEIQIYFVKTKKLTEEKNNNTKSAEISIHM